MGRSYNPATTEAGGRNRAPPIVDARSVRAFGARQIVDDRRHLARA
jgi:hypothetical protein